MNTPACADSPGRRRPPWLALSVVTALLMLSVLVGEVQAAGLQAKIVAFGRAGAALRARVEVSEVFSERWRRSLAAGTTLYLRIETEIWEERALWNRLVRPAIVSVSRVTMDSASRSVVVVDPFGHATVYTANVPAVSVWADLVPVDRVADEKTYYVRGNVVLGSVAQSEISGVSDAVFGAGSQSGGLASLGKLVFQKVLRLADYLDSVSCDLTSPKLSGARMKASAVSGR